MAHQLKPTPLDLVGGSSHRRTAPSSTPVEVGDAVHNDGGVAVLIDPVTSGGVGTVSSQTGARVLTRPLIAEAIAHELRATLALISGYSQTVQHLPLDNDVRMRYLERISTASLSLSELADEVVAVASSPQRGSEPLPEPLSLRQVYTRLAGQLGGAIDSLKLTVDAPVDLPLVEADPIWVTLVVRGLVTNATKYAAGSTIALAAWQSGEWVITRVADDGDGIDETERGRLFEPAFRGRRARENGLPGSGQGLYLCKRLVEAHGGRIWIDETSEGFAVCFSLPRASRPFVLARDQDGRELIAVGPGESERRGA